jgi:hypothetical protein
MNENEKPPEAAASTEPQPKPPGWEYRKNFRINEEMKKVINLTIAASQAEIAVLRRKLQKLTYGS